jgi:uncharacterized protein
MHNLTVTLSGDRMMAYISGTVNDCGTIEDIERLIITTLAEHGVVFGFQDHLISLVAGQFFRQETVKATIVALGEYSRPEESGGLQFSVPTYPHSVFPPDFKYNANTPIHYRRLIEYIEKPGIVREHEVVGKLSSHKKGSRGTNVLGEPDTSVTGVETLSLSESLGPGLLTQYNASEILAHYTGIVVKKKDLAFVLPVDLDAGATASVTPDRLTLLLELLPPGPGGKTMTAGEALALVSEQYPRVANIDKKAIEEACAAVAAGANERTVVIASGTPPQKGEDGRIEYFIDLSFSQRPEIMADGRANYYNIHIFENVNKGQALARIRPATQGIAGTDVFGTPIAAEPGREAHLNRGKNVQAAASAPLTIEAAKNGHVYLHDDTLYVEEVLHLPSDVDYGTGNISFSGDVEIRGDIKSGFTVKTSGSICVGGAVEDAVVEAGGSVVVHSGFVGTGKGRIRAGGDAVVKYVRNQTIMAKNNILIEGEAMDSNLYAGNEMFVEVKKSWIVGGVAVARNRIRAHALGNSSCLHTEVATGIDIFISKLLSELEREIIALEKEYQIILSSARQLSAQGSSAGRPAPALDAMQGKLAAILEQHSIKLKQLHKYKDHYEKTVYDTKGDIGVTDTVYPGVLLKIGGLTHLVQDELQNCLFYIHEGRIATRSLS